MGEPLDLAGCIRLAIRDIASQRAQLRSMCAEYAERTTGWKVGDTVVDVRRGTKAVIQRFAGTHPQKWNAEPVVLCKWLRADGNVGVRDVYITIDLEGRWERRWKALTNESPESSG